MRQSFDVIIVGAGPAGSAAALQLSLYGPELARRTLLIDAQAFPRDKLCGGGVVPEADRFLAHLGVDAAVPAVPIRAIRFEYHGGASVVRGRHFFRVVHREAFDQALLRAARERGVEVRDGIAVEYLVRERDRIRVGTRDGQELSARVVIGADGARSRVRRELVGCVRGDRFVALETLTPGHDVSGGGDSETAVFDFRPAATGLRGYAWDFPSLRRGERWMNRGLAAGARTSDAPLRQVFEAALGARGLEPQPHGIQGAGAPFYDPTRPQGAERVLLAGDAVGLDPWFGEGISVALGTGILAAHAAAGALDGERFAFADHARRIERSAVGWSLQRKRLIAERFYPVAGVRGGLGAFLGGEVAA